MRLFVGAVKTFKEGRTMKRLLVISMCLALAIGLRFSLADSRTSAAIALPGKASDVDSALQDQTGSISGHVYEADGVTPIEGATVEVLVGRKHPVASAVTLADGSYTVP